MGNAPSNPAPGPATPGRWLTIVGIGEAGIDALSPRAIAAIADAELVFGGHRHLALAAPGIAGRAIHWPSPFDPMMAAVRAARGRRVCVLASGDPFLFGVGATLSRHIPADEMAVLPSPSAFSLAAARLGWPLAEVETISLHGRARDRLRPLLHPATRILALTNDADDPAQIAALLTGAGFGRSDLTLLEALGGPRERIRHVRADGFDLGAIDPLNLLAIDVVSDERARIIPLGGGRPDDLFEHDGQITKREIRAVTLSMLAPRRGELLWDVGAGSGSIGIEWMLAHPGMRAIAIEPRAERVERITLNAARMGVPGLSILAGSAPDALPALATAGRDLHRRRRNGARRCRRGDRSAAPRRSTGHQRGDAGDRGRPARPPCPSRGQFDPHRRIAGRSDRDHDRVAQRDAGHDLVVDQAMILAGFGCRRGATTGDFIAALAQALEIARCEYSTLAGVALPHFRQAEPGAIAATTLWGLPVEIVDQPALAQACRRAETHSALAFAHTGLTSVAESAALAAAGPGSRLLARRTGAGSVTCAIAIGERGS